MILTLLFGGCLPQWTVLTPANPNPLVGVDHLDLSPLAFTNLRVGADSEADYLARKSPDQQDSWARDKEILAEQFRLAAMAGAARCKVTLDPPGGPGEFTIAAEVNSIEPGFYGGVVEMPSGVEVTSKLTHRGVLAEQILFAHGTSPSNMSVGPVNIPSYPSVTDRLRADGHGLGEILGDYVCARVAGK